MDKKIVQAVLEKSKGLCEVCYAPFEEVDRLENEDRGGYGSTGK